MHFYMKDLGPAFPLELIAKPCIAQDQAIQMPGGDTDGGSHPSDVGLLNLFGSASLEVEALLVTRMGRSYPGFDQSFGS